MRRIGLAVALVLSIVLAPLVVLAEATKVYRIGFLARRPGKPHLSHESGALLVDSGQIRLRRIDCWPKIASVLKQHTPVAA